SETGEAFQERPLLVVIIKRLCLSLRQSHQFHAERDQAGLFIQHRDGADVMAADGVRLDEGECAFGHTSTIPERRTGIKGAYVMCAASSPGANTPFSVMMPVINRAG